MTHGVRLPAAESLTPETAIRVFIKLIAEVLNVHHLRQWLINVPFQVGPHPVQAPNLAGFHPCGFGHWLDAARIQGVDLRGGYEFDLLDLAIRAAIDGLGITIADRQMVARELAAGQLVQVLDVQVDGHQSYWWVTRPEQELPPHVERFRDWLMQEVWLAERNLGGPSEVAGCE